MQLDIKTLSSYRLDRAKEDLQAAVSNHQAGFYKVAINRSYYVLPGTRMPLMFVLFDERTEAVYHAEVEGYGRNK